MFVVSSYPSIWKAKQKQLGYHEPHNKVLSLMMTTRWTMNDDDDGRFDFFVVVCYSGFPRRNLYFTVFYPQNGFGNPKRCTMKDSVPVCVFLT